LRQSNIDENPLKALWPAGNGIKGWSNQRKPQGDITVGIMNSFALKLQEVIFKSNMTMPKNKCIMIWIGRTKFCNGRVYQLDYSALSEYITKPDHQEMLNLIMFYHNHRRYKNGKRSDKTPYEMLTGKQQEKDWMELIFDIIDDKTHIFNDLIRLSPARQILIRW
jgi:hypothetical protein